MMSGSVCSRLLAVTVHSELQRVIGEHLLWWPSTNSILMVGIQNSVRSAMPVSEKLRQEDYYKFNAEEKPKAPVTRELSRSQTLDQEF